MALSTVRKKITQLMNCVDVTQLITNDRKCRYISLDIIPFLLFDDQGGKVNTKADSL